jgi:hypothetical protein
MNQKDLLKCCTLMLIQVSKIDFEMIKIDFPYLIFVPSFFLVCSCLCKLQDVCRIFLAIIFSVTVFLVGCAGKSQENQPHLALRYLAFDEAIKVALDSVTKMSLQDNAFCSYRDSTFSTNDVLMLYNRAAKRLQYYDLGTGQPLRTIQLATEGPDGVGESFFAQIINQDSVFLLEPFAYKLRLVNRVGKVIRTYRLLNAGVKFNEVSGKVPEGEYSALPDGGFGRSIVKVGKYLYMGGFSNQGNWLERTYTHQAKTLIRLDLETGQLAYGVPFSPAYDRDAYYPSPAYDFSFAFSPQTGQFAYTYPIDPAVYPVSLDLQVLGEGRLAPSNRAAPFAPMKKPNIDFNEEYLHFIQQTSYPAILYDPYREVFYRFVYHPQAGPHIAKVQNKELKIAHSIIVLDKDFRVISEQLFDKYFFVPRAFVGKQGLYVEGSSFKWQQEQKYRYTEDTMLLMRLTLKPGKADE